LTVIIYYYGLLRIERSTIRSLIKEGASLKNQSFKVGTLFGKICFLNKKTLRVAKLKTKTRR
jgi:hypothetical protein